MISSGTIFQFVVIKRDYLSLSLGRSFLLAIAPKMDVFAEMGIAAQTRRLPIHLRAGLSIARFAFLSKNHKYL